MRLSILIALIGLSYSKTVITAADREKACKGKTAKEWADCNYDTCNGKKPLDVKTYPRCKYFDTDAEHCQNAGTKCDYDICTKGKFEKAKAPKAFAACTTDCKKTPSET